MPTPLPVKIAVPASPISRANGPLDIWAVSLGLVAMGLASLVHFAAGDSIAAALIMVGAAIIIIVERHIVDRASAPD